MRSASHRSGCCRFVEKPGENQDNRGLWRTPCRAAGRAAAEARQMHGMISMLWVRALRITGGRDRGGPGGYVFGFRFLSSFFLGRATGRRAPCSGDAESPRAARTGAIARGRIPSTPGLPRRSRRRSLALWACHNPPVPGADVNGKHRHPGFTRFDAAPPPPSNLFRVAYCAPGLPGTAELAARGTLVNCRDRDRIIGNGPGPSWA